MHEFSIIDSLISTVLKECRDAGFSKVEKVKISVGKASGVMPAALLFAFDALKQDTIASEASLLIEEILITGQCNNCECDFTSEESFIFACPCCQSNSFKINSGRELDILEIEVI